MLVPYARAQRLIDSLTAVRSSIALKLNITDTAAMLAGKESLSNKSTAIALGISDVLYPTQRAVKYYVDNTLTTAAADYLRLSGGTMTGRIVGTTVSLSDTLVAATGTFSGTLTGTKATFADTVKAKAFLRTGGTASQFLMADGSVASGNSFSGTGTTNYLSKFTGTTSFGNSSIYDDGTKVGIATASPSSLFQIGAEGSTDLNLKFDAVTNSSLALKFGYRNYQWRMKANTNSGTLDPLVFSYYNGTTDLESMTLSSSGVSIPGTLTTGGNISGAQATLAGLNVNNGQLSVDNVNNRVGLFAPNPSAMFQVGGDANTDLNLKYDVDPNNSSALKLGYRNYQWRIKTSTNSGVLLPLVFSYYNGTTDVDILSLNYTGGLTASSFIKTGGTSAQFLKADGSIDASSYLTTNSVREVADQASATASQTAFTLTQTPSANSKVKMYVNGIRISNTAYSVTGATLTYIPANNGGYSLLVNDRIQFDYYY
jgi:hypothetical protein